MKTVITAFTIMAVLISCTDNHKPTVRESAQVDSLLFSTVKELNLERTLALTDSLENARVISPAKADFVRGRAYDEGWQMYLAEHYYRKAHNACGDPIEDWWLFAESGYRLSAVLAMRLDIEGSLNVATQLMEIAEKEPRFPIVYKAFLLNNIAWCQRSLHQDEEAMNNYLLAYETLQTEEGTVSPMNYRSDMFNMTLDIADYYYMLGDYEEAFGWIERCEEQYRLYAQEPGAPLIGENGAHVTLRKAVILNALDRKKEAEAVYRSVDLSMIKNPPGITWQGRYLMATGRYGEAADCYARLDTTYVATDRAKASFDFISERLLPRFEANLKAGRTKESLELGTAIHQALDSVIVLGRKTRATELSTIYETQKKELAIRSYYFKVNFYRFAMVITILILLFITWLLFRIRHLYKKLQIKDRQMYEEMQSKMEESNKYVEQLQDSPTEKLSSNQQLYLKICQTIEKDKLYKDLDLNRVMLANIIGTNYKYVGNAIRECTGGLTVNQFINKLRVQHAAKLLKESEHSITTVMDLSGFNNRSNFNKIFREYFKLSPSEYRRAALDESSSPLLPPVEGEEDSSTPPL